MRPSYYNNNNPLTKVFTDRRIRRLPGPAGDWDSHNKPKDEQFSLQQAIWSRQFSNNNTFNERGLMGRQIPLIDPIFWKGAWLSAMTAEGIIITHNKAKSILEMECSVRTQFMQNLASIKSSNKTVHKIDRLIVGVRELTILKEGTAMLVDPFDSMKAIFGRDCFENDLTSRSNRNINKNIANINVKFNNNNSNNGEFDYCMNNNNNNNNNTLSFNKNDIQNGCVMILKNVTILHEGPTIHDFYVIISTNNIENVYPNGSSVPKILANTLRKFHNRLGYNVNLSTQITPAATVTMTTKCNQK